MTRINTNVAAMTAHFNLTKSQQDLSLRLERLSTGLRINRAKDGPAALITSERLRTEIASMNEAIANSERASSVIATTEGSLSEVSELLNSIKGLLVQAANTGGISEEEREANQLQIDSAIDSITRISNTASFAGLQLLNGSLDYVTSGLASSAVVKSEIQGANIGTADSLSVNVDVLASAEVAQVTLGASAGSGTLLSSLTLEVAGAEGEQVLQFVSGTAMSAVGTAVNQRKDSTGISASLVDASDLSSGVVFSSTDFGSDAFVSVNRIGDSGDFFDDEISANRDTGRDVVAVVNGMLAEGDGLSINVRNPTLNISLLLDSDFAQQTASDTTFHITGGGANFQLGPEVKTNQQISFGVRSIAASRLGGVLDQDELVFLSSIKSGGDNDLDSGNLTRASKIVDKAVDEIAVLRGQLGAIERNTLETNVRSMQVALENITAAESKIRDADFAYETSALTRAQILVQSGTSVLATANSTSQSVLQLLG